MKTQNQNRKNANINGELVKPARRNSQEPACTAKKSGSFKLTSTPVGAEHIGTPSNRIMETVTGRLANKHWGILESPKLPNMLFAYANQGYADDKRAKSVFRRFSRNLKIDGIEVWLQAFSDDRYSWVMLVDSTDTEEILAKLDSAVNAVYGDEYYHIHSSAGLVSRALADYVALRGESSN